MNQLLFGYDPRCDVYQRTRKSGNSYWYIKYYLPNGELVRRPCAPKYADAKKQLSVKRLQLLAGHFDDKDLAKMPLQQFSSRQHERLEIQEAITMYLESTAANKTPQTQYNDRVALNMLFGWFEQRGRQYMDEITPYDVQQLLLFLHRDNKAEASIKTYLRTVSKVFSWLIDDMELLDMRHPAKKVTVPKKNGLVRERLISDVEFDALLSAPYASSSSLNTPISEIVRFLGFTGARLGECLHAEWSDFDLENGVWRIRHKPKCPTKDGLGWSPKWKKSRVICLFPEAVELLQSLPRYQTVGAVQVRDESGKIVDRMWHAGKFVFPKREVHVVDGERQVRYCRVDRVSRSWATLKRNAGIYDDLQVKDLRTYFNHILKSRYGFSSKEAGVYIGNSKEVNDAHYTPVSLMSIREKMAAMGLSEACRLGVVS